MRFLLFLLCMVGVPAPVLAQSFAWPGGRAAAIVLTYDDSLTSHLDVAAPQLEAMGMRGTFFLNGTFPSSYLERWRKLARKGHELGNHSLFHPCPEASFAMEPQFRSEGYSIAGMLREIGAMNTFLAAIDGKRARTFAVPCSISLAGGMDYTDPLRASGLIRYVRTGVPSGGVVSDRAQLDPFRVPSRSFPESASADDLIAFVKDVQHSGGLGVFMFHGVGGDYQQVSAEAHLGLLRYLRAQRKDIWVAPFQEVMDRASSASPPIE